MATFPPLCLISSRFKFPYKNTLFFHILQKTTCFSCRIVFELFAFGLCKKPRVLHTFTKREACAARSFFAPTRDRPGKVKKISFLLLRSGRYGAMDGEKAHRLYFRKTLVRGRDGDRGAWVRPGGLLAS